MASKCNGKAHLLTFEEEGHIYRVDGKRVPSITQVIKINHPDKYKDVDEEVLKRAARLGTEMHQAIQDYEELGLESELQELIGYKFLKLMYKFEFVEAEKPILIEYKGKFLLGDATNSSRLMVSI